LKCSKVINAIAERSSPVALHSIQASGRGSLLKDLRHPSQPIICKSGPQFATATHLESK